MSACDLAALSTAASEFVAVVDKLYGLYLDSQAGFLANADVIERNHAMTAATAAPGTDLDSLPLIIGRGDPNDPSNVTQHTTTQGEFKARNRRGGENHVLLGQLFVVQLYSFWEVGYRPRLARAMGKEPDELKLEIFGDLRLLRHDVLHNLGVVDQATVRRLEVLSVPAGQRLVLDELTIEMIARVAKALMDKLVVDAGGQDPQHRRVWRV
jgi:hypothetical protein